ncbi:MAG TPA: hypothetical protein DIT10_05700 [Chryseobacterium sp.]|nr:hypothetical protein [Chryseobacterium sp.]
MNTTEDIYKIITSIEDSQDYLELGEVDLLVYPLQKLSHENWEHLMIQIKDWTEKQRMILTNAIIEIDDNKKSDYDTAKIFALSLILAEQKNAEVLMEHLDFLNNGIPKDIELINQLFDKIKWLENNQQNLFLNFEKAHSLINQLYINGVIVNATQLPDNN